MRLALAAVLLLAGLVPATTGQAAPLTDMQVTSASLLATPTWTDGVPAEGLVQANVTNRGSAAMAYRLEYGWRPTGGSTQPLNGDAASSVDAGEPLPPGKSRVHEAPWRLAEGIAGAGHLVVRVIATSATRDQLPGNDESLVPAFVPVRAVRLADAGSLSADIPSDATRFLRLTIHNDGNEGRDIHLSVPRLEPAEARVQASIEPAVVHVPAGASAQPTLYVRFQPDGDVRPFLTKAVVSADPGFGAPRTTRTGPLRPDSTGTGDGYGFAIEHAGPGPLHVPTDRSVATKLRVLNLGAQADDVQLSADVPPGWQVAIDPARVALDPGQWAEVILRMRSSSGPQGEPFPIRITGFSGATSQTQALDLGVRRAGAALRLLAMEVPPLYLGDAPEARLLLVNAGDAAVPGGTSLRVRLEAGGVQHQVIADGPSTLAPGAQSWVHVPLGKLTQAGSLALQASWMAPAHVLSPPPVDIVAFVHAPAFQLLAPTPLGGAPGERVVYGMPPHALQVHNSGNAAEEVVLSLAADAGEAAFEGSAVLALAPGQTRSVPISLTLPLPAGTRLSANVTVVVSVLDRHESWNATWRTDIRDVRPPEVAIRALAQAVQGRQAVLHVNATDDGQVGQVAANVTAPDGKVRAISLDRSGPAWVAQWTPYDLGTHTVRATALDAAGNRGNATLAVTVQAQPQPVLEWVGSKAIVAPGSRLSFRIDQDVRDATAVLRIEGKSRGLEVQVHQDRVDVVVPAESAGNATLVVTAESASGRAVLEVAFAIAGAPVTQQDSGQRDVAPTPRRDAGSASAPGAAAALAALAALARRRGA